ncbi:MAG: glycosyltransferase [Lachnospiraceae bacterium]|nr:glycosyltransferase [Lachnospiraceae bacterium]MEE0920547.1 glycosyltransferase family 2 protein [Lachnospiraceae bacterium]
MKNNVFYSIIVVCLNAGDRLAKTVESILAQKYENYEIVIKDGGSKDGSVQKIKDKYENEDMYKHIKIYEQKDSSIYDAMNQAVRLANGDYCIFLNAGDDFYDETVLGRIADGIKNESYPDIVYGNLYHKALDTVIYSSPEINDFACYRNVPCHQTCFYKRNMFDERGYNPEYNVRADYEHFLWCYFAKKARIVYIPEIVSSYEGGGYSETKENLKLSARQHREIVVKYMGKRKADKYRMIMLLTLAPLRSFMANNKHMSGIYNSFKTLIYKLKNKKG